MAYEIDMTNLNKKSASADPQMAQSQKSISTAKSIYASQAAVDSFVAIGEGYNEASAIRAKRVFANNNIFANARIAKMSAEDALKRGALASDDHMARIGRLIGSQRAAFATQGIEIDTGSAKQIQEETFNLGLEDAVTIRNNSYLEAFGFESQAANLKSQSILNRIASKSAEKQEKAAAIGRVAQAIGSGAMGVAAAGNTNTGSK